MACCDVFLPIATTVEHDGMVVTHYGLNSSFYGAQNKCVQVGECKSDVEAMMAVGKKMYPDFWNRFETQTDYDNFHVMRSWLPYEELREKVTVMSNEPYYKYEVGKLRPDGQVGFPTSTGRVELYSYMYEQFGENPLPYYEDPAYGPERTPELMEKYPFILTTGARRQEFFHSEHKQVPSLRQITPYPQIDLNPADAARLGIEEDDWVEIASPYGAVRQRAHVVPTIKEGVCHAMHGWWYPEEDGEEPNLFGNWKSNINVLMPNSVNGVMGFGNTFKQMICSLKKVEGEGGPNDPDSTGIFLEPSRQAEFTYQQVWRPTDETQQGLTTTRRGGNDHDAESPVHRLRVLLRLPQLRGGLPQRDRMRHRRLGHQGAGGQAPPARRRHLALGLHRPARRAVRHVRGAHGGRQAARVRAILPGQVPGDRHDRGMRRQARSQGQEGRDPRPLGGAAGTA